MSHFWEDGILIKHRGIPFKINVSKGTKNLYYKEAVLHISGTLVLITDKKDVLYYLPINVYSDYLEDIKSKDNTYVTTNVDNESIKLKWGEWLRCIL